MQIYHLAAYALATQYNKYVPYVTEEEEQNQSMSNDWQNWAMPSSSAAPWQSKPLLLVELFVAIAVVLVLVVDVLNEPLPSDFAAVLNVDEHLLV